MKNLSREFRQALMETFDIDVDSDGAVLLHGPVEDIKVLTDSLGLTEFLHFYEREFPHCEISSQEAMRLMREGTNTDIAFLISRELNSPIISMP